MSKKVAVNLSENDLLVLFSALSGEFPHKGTSKASSLEGRISNELKQFETEEVETKE